MLGDNDTVNLNQFEDWKLRDLNSGELIEVITPGSFVLETVLLDSAYYRFRGKEYRFLLCKARELGLKVA